MNTKFNQPKRGDIWLVNFDPTIGAEIKKTRPAIVISSDAVGRLPLKLIAPVTNWQPYFAQNFWHVKMESTSENGLTKDSAIDTLQLRGVDIRRFIRELGHVPPEKMMEITIAIATVIELET